MTGPDAPEPPATGSRSAWWRDAVIYQVYLRSFADGSGDGLGDLAGLRARLPHLSALGVDALWINPWYRSPQADAGYDVADYRAIDPRFGDLTDAEALIAEAHEHGLRVIADLVPNHTSEAHAWFQEALAAGPGSAARARYWFRPGRGDGPPNDWESNFGGPAWTRLDDGDWYLHLFAPEQPDLDWSHPAVGEEFRAILRFWFDRGIDGFRIDVAHGLVKDPALPDLAGRTLADFPPGGHPYADRDGVHAIYRDWRAVADEYPDERIFVAEAWVADPERLALYVRPDELQTAFTFDFLQCPWEPVALRSTIDAVLERLVAVGAPATWVLSNHDVVRHPSRYGRPAVAWQPNTPYAGTGEPDLALGRRRARAALLLELALPGSTYVYQGEELGLAEVEDLPESALADPVWERSGHTQRGRDGCRVPIPWSGSAPPYGFSAASGQPWLPQPAGWAELTVAAETGDPASMVELYRAALARRRASSALGDGALTWMSAPGEEVLVFDRSPGFRCVVNLSDDPVPVDGEVVLASLPLEEGLLPVDAAVWLRR